MRRFLFTMLAIVPLVVMAQAKIGVVNSAEVFNLMPEKANAEQQLKSRSDMVQAENERIQKDFNQKFADYQEIASDATVPETIKERRIQELQKLDKDIQEFQAKEMKQLDAYRAELMDPIVQAIQTAIEDVSIEEGLSIVFDTAKTPVAFTGPDTQDITPKVMQRLGIK